MRTLTGSSIHDESGLRSITPFVPRVRCENSVGKMFTGEFPKTNDFSALRVALQVRRSESSSTNWVDVQVLNVVSPGLLGEDPEGGARLGQLLPLHGIGLLLRQTTNQIWR